MTREINLIVVHASATPVDMDIGAEEIRCWHTDPKPKGRGWDDIGYHYVIRRNGVRELGRPIEKQGAHAHGFNEHSIGICLVGGVNANDRTKAEANFTHEQYAELNKLLIELCYMYVIPRNNVVGHRDLPGVTKACPCFDVKGFFNSPFINGDY